MDIETVPNAPATKEAPNAKVDAGNDKKSEKRASDAGRDGSAPEAGKETAAERKYRVKVGKEEREVSERELIAGYQMRQASDARFQTAAQKEKAIRDALEKADFDSLIEKKTGKKALEFYKDKLKGEIRKATMSGQEREAAEAQERLDSLKREEQEILSRRNQEKMEAMQTHYEEQYDRDLSDAISKNGLPKNQYAIGRAVALAQKVVDMGLEPDWDLVVKEAKNQIQDDLKQLLAAFKDDEGLLGFFGEEIPHRISKALVTRGGSKQSSAKVENKPDGGFRRKEPTVVDLEEWSAKKAREFGK